MPISCDIPQLIGMFFMFYAAQHKKIFGKIVQNTELCRRYPFGSFLLERTTSNFSQELNLIIAAYNSFTQSINT